MARKYSNSELEAYLDEGLEPQAMAELERALRGEPDLLHRLAEINRRRDAGVHTLGEIWRRHRLSCPSREQMGSFLLGALHGDAEDYIRFHLETIGCRYCLANIADLERRQKEESTTTTARRSRYFQSSAGYLRQ
ncbi:MAG: hypothetical protein KDA59_03565 [Planctomycetales bacterium]|nr:hypothetical protein [Planctomycetales bacterium]MCA9202092.1 hypothetical protein [Planctomycetales bacterium]